MAQCKFGRVQSGKRKGLCRKRKVGGRKKGRARKRASGSGRHCITRRTAAGRSISKCYASPNAAHAALERLFANRTSYKSVLLYTRK